MKNFRKFCKFYIKNAYDFCILLTNDNKIAKCEFDKCSYFQKHLKEDIEYMEKEKMKDKLEINRKLNIKSSEIKIEEIENNVVRAGLELGIYQDHTYYIKISVSEDDKKIYIHDSYIKSGMKLSDLAVVLNTQINSLPHIYCDNCMPKEIDYLSRNTNIYYTKVVKYAKSTEKFLTELLKYEIIINEKCKEFENELKKIQIYFDETGNNVTGYSECDGIMALKYAMEGYY